VDASLLGRDRLRLGAAVLLVGIVGLGALQYRWLREVADAQRSRMRADAQSRAAAIAQDFDREITHAFLTLPLDATTVASGDASGYASRYEEFRRAARWPNLVRGVFLHKRGAAELQRFSPEEQRLVASEWPAQLEPIRARLTQAEPGPLPTVVAEIPALLVPTAFTFKLTPRPAAAAPAPPPHLGELPATLNHMVVRSAHAEPAGPCTIVQLDRDVLIGQILPQLVAQRLVTEGISEFEASVVESRSGKLLYGVAGAGDGDAGADLLRVRLEELDSAILRSLAPGLSPRPGGERVSVRMVETVAGSGPGASATGRWRLVLRHKLGSVEQAVATALRRNLAVAFSVLGVLGASVVLIAASARRARALAERQMEFVAAVSHELRTPLAVIRSAGENLADGVVSESAQVKRYGGIVRDEGLRLSEMVEQVLSFAGADARSRDREPVDLVAVVERALAGEGAGIERVFPPEAARALGDSAGIERAVRNLVGNARKYAGEAAIGVRVESRPASAPPAVAIVVWDRGPGIAAEDRERLFEPFFRGRNARDAQVPGSGLGLAVVRRIAEGLGGRVEVSSTPGEGATFTLILEAAPAAAVPATDVQAHPAR